MATPKDWPVAHTLDDWMRQQEKRTMREERRPRVTRPSDLLGPGIAPTAVEINDWSGPETAFNGFYYSKPGALHSPDSAKWWIGESVTQEGTYGFQRVTDYRSDTGALTMLRTFKLVGDTRLFSPWAVVSGGSGGASAADLAAHINSTTNVHGITNTAQLVKDDFTDMTVTFENGLV